MGYMLGGSKTRGTFLGVPEMRITLFCSSYLKNSRDCNSIGLRV